MTSVGSIINGTIDREGEEYVDHPDDRGGPTRWGVTEKVARENGYVGDMRHLPRDFAYQVFYYKYYLQPRFNLVAQVSLPVAERMTDAAVLCGAGRPPVWLQRCLNAFNMKQKFYPDLKVDGAIGPTTCAALRSFLAHRGREGEEVLINAMGCLQGAYFVEITEAREANESFIFGWMSHRVRIT